MRGLPRVNPAAGDTLHRALSTLAQRGHLDLDWIRRISVERNGKLHIEIRGGGKLSFFEFNPDGLRELKPEDDPHVPSAAKLHDPVFAAQHRIISYRPGRRLVMASFANDPGVVIKGYKKRGARAASSRHTLAMAACKTGGFGVPDLLRRDGDSDALIMAKQPGRTPRVSAESAGIWACIGACLKQFQQASLVDGLPEFSSVDELGVLDERARRTQFMMQFLPEDWQAGRELLEDCATRLDGVTKGLSHRDLHDGQFIIEGETVVLLDFDLLCVADVALDAGNLLAHFELRSLQSGRGRSDSTVSACSDALRTGLGRQQEPGFRKRVLYYQATTFYRLALLYAIRPRWAHLTGALVQAGRRCVDAFNGQRVK